jgi:hypothetical protein
VVHEALLLYKLDFLSIPANPFSKTSIPPNKISGFTGQNLIQANKTKGVHGFTGLAGYSDTWLCLYLFVSRRSDLSRHSASASPARTSTAEVERRRISYHFLTGSNTF